MRRILLLTFAFLVPLGAHASEPQFFIRDVATLADCHREYTALAGSWQGRPSFRLRKISNGRERVVNCLADGVAEYVCNPAGGKLAVAVVEGATSPSCKRYAAPQLPATVVKSLIPVQ